METSLKILILEDSIDDADLIKRLIKKEFKDAEFFVAMNKDSFIQALDDFAPDIILSDNSLPNFDGSEALNLTRHRSLHIPFILVTGTVSEEFAPEDDTFPAAIHWLPGRRMAPPCFVGMTLRSCRQAAR